MKKGFTLIELLAVIVILAIIALISVPIIMNIIDKAKDGALKDSGYGILDAAELYLSKNINNSQDTMEFICNNGKCLSGTEEIKYKGQIESGRVRIYSDYKIELCIEGNNSSALKTVTSKEVIVSKGSCNYEELNYGVTALVSKTALDEANKKYEDLKALVDQMDVTAEDVKDGKKVLVDGQIVTGTLKAKELYVVANIGSMAIRADLRPSYTYDIKTITDNYPNLTVNDFIISAAGGWGVTSANGWNDAAGVISKSYNATTGILSITTSYSTSAGGYEAGAYSVVIYMLK